ncbi:hypothetical protein FRC06_006957 [Ceratobasidium sp. 370]|nr:hypothetical protein FRC06_006957 [Ceratobasidium sp. 370]
MVRLLSSVLSALALSSAVLAVPTMPMYNPEPAMAEPAMATTTSSATMHETTSAKMKEGSTSTAMAHEAMTTSTSAVAYEAMTTSTTMMAETTTSAAAAATTTAIQYAGPHTVTKSSSLTVCNKSAEPDAFASGMQNASFVFDQVVNTTDPTFFYCAVATHCAKGMFGIINPPSAPAGSATSVGMMMSTWTSQNPDLAKMQSAVDKMTVNTPAYNWASNLDAGALPTEAHQSLVENIFQTRMFYAMNPGAEQGASRPDGQPLSIPSDVSTLLSGTAANPGGANGAPAGGVPSGTPTGTSDAASSTPTASANGAKGLAASSALIAGVAVLSSLFLF